MKRQISFITMSITLTILVFAMNGCSLKEQKIPNVSSPNQEMTQS